MSIFDEDVILIPAADALRAWEDHDVPAFKWEELHPDLQEHYRIGARLVLEAAAAAYKKAVGS